MGDKILFQLICFLVCILSLLSIYSIIKAIRKKSSFIISGFFLVSICILLVFSYFHWKPLKIQDKWLSADEGFPEFISGDGYLERVHFDVEKRSEEELSDLGDLLKGKTIRRFSNEPTDTELFSLNLEVKLAQRWNGEDGKIYSYRLTVSQPEKSTQDNQYVAWIQFFYFDGRESPVYYIDDVDGIVEWLNTNNILRRSNG
ncbi:MAG: hypothetical protein IJ744_12620 [Lachnospiraceae bacterium]|nr:hypothetical protein [Lachnospiraceae bacterium]